MILETTNPKYQSRAQIPAGRKFYIQTQDRGDLEFISDGSRSMARGELQLAAVGLLALVIGICFLMWITTPGTVIR
jgi:hypothetical protein